jgi:hypothetical protein
MYAQKNLFIRIIYCNIWKTTAEPQMAPKNSKVAAKNSKYDALILWIVGDALK